MSETKTDRLFNGMAEIVEWIKQTAESAGGFIMEQAPLVAQEIIIFGRVKYTIILILCIISVTVGSYAAKKICTEKPDDECRFICLACVAMFGVVFGMVHLFIHLEPCIKVWSAPRLYLIEYLGDLIR